MKKNQRTLQNFEWIDFEDPHHADLLDISEDYDIPLTYLAHCLDPEHLPKFESTSNYDFIVLRVCDPDADPTAGSIQELTTKIILFVSPHQIITLHRKHIPFLSDKLQKCSFEAVGEKEFLKYVFTSVFNTYDVTLTDLEMNTANLEEDVYSQNHQTQILREGYNFKRRASAYKKSLKISLEVLTKFENRPALVWSDFAELKYHIDVMLFYADDVIENIGGLLNLHVSLLSQKTNQGSYRTNEVMRVLTIFSIFFLPLNFIAGIYGMNFENIPELKHPYGYFITLAVMIVMSLSIFAWIYRKGWMKAPKE
ncbi:MAG: CorA family divalent cation transporter [Pseudobdellovibrionaceae bacterium]